MSALGTMDAVTLDTLYNSGDLPILGHVAFWQVNHVEIAHLPLYTALKNNDFAGVQPPMPTYRAALRAAIEEWLDQQGKRKVVAQGGGKAQRDRISVVNSDNKPTMSFVVLTEDLDLGRLSLTSGTRLRFILWKEGVGAGRFTATTTATGGTDEQINEEKQIVQEVGALYAKHRMLYDSGAIASIILKIVETMRPIPLRPGGGVYFLPAAFRAKVDQLRALCAAIAADGGPKADIGLTITPVFNLGEMRQTYGKLALNSMQAEAATMERYLRDQFLDKPAGTVKPATIAAQLTQFKEFRVKAEAYAELLQIKADDLVGATQRLEALARQVVVKGALAPTDDAADPFSAK